MIGAVGGIRMEAVDQVDMKVKSEKKYEWVEVILEEERLPYEDANWMPGRFWR
jgi:hypothetical protein